MSLGKIFYFSLSSLLVSLMLSVNYYIAGLAIVKFLGKGFSSFLLDTSFGLAFLSFLVVYYILTSLYQTEGELISGGFYFLYIINIFIAWLVVLIVFYVLIFDAVLYLVYLIPSCLFLLMLLLIIKIFLDKSTVGFFNYGKSFFRLLFFLIISTLILSAVFYMVLTNKIANSCRDSLDESSKNNCEYQRAVVSANNNSCLELVGGDDDGLTYRDKCLFTLTQNSGNTSACRLILDDKLLDRCLSFASEDKQK